MAQALLGLSKIVSKSLRVQPSALCEQAPMRALRWQTMEKAQAILIVDDDSTHRLMLNIILRSCGYCTHEARNGLDALRLIHQKKVDLVLMDIFMPGLSGIQVLAEIKSFNPCVPVILMTAYCSAKTILEAKNKGAVGVLDKPLHLDELKEVIVRVLKQGCLA
jgi:two-component system response regulator HydG